MIPVVLNWAHPHSQAVRSPLTSITCARPPKEKSNNWSPATRGPLPQFHTCWSSFYPGPARTAASRAPARQFTPPYMRPRAK